MSRWKKVCCGLVLCLLVVLCGLAGEYFAMENGALQQTLEGKTVVETEIRPLETKTCAEESLGAAVMAAAMENMNQVLLQQTAVPEAYQIQEFPIVLQMPQLPTGCEITALTMALQYYGYPADKTVMVSQYLPTLPADFYYGSDGRCYGPDMENYFVGNPFTNLGYICGTSAIVTAANRYLQEQGSSLRAVDRTGTAVEELYELVSQDTPVVVWVTIGMADRRTTQGWYTQTGEYMEWSTNDHGAVLIGYTQDTVTIADPISGMVEYSRTQFEEVFASRGSRCVILEG